MLTSRLLLVLAALLFASGCNCGGKLRGVYEEPPDASVPLVQQPPGSCESGVASGRVCAPDQRTWLNGAQVSVSGEDCNGVPFQRATTTDAEGRFELANLPAGAWKLHASLGSFSQDYQVNVVTGQTTVIPDDQLCIAQKATRIAVVTGAGDKIEQLLSGLNLTFDTFGGEAGAWAGSAEPFLLDLEKMKTYDLIFFDCAAGKTSSGSQIDLGPRSAALQRNLKDYVLGGGSIYASDWAFLFPALSFPGKFDVRLQGTGPVNSPFDPHRLTGFAPQTLQGTVEDPELATFLGKQQVAIAFPNQQGAVSRNWGLIEEVGAGVEVLIRSSKATLCNNSSCSSAGSSVKSVPLAVQWKMTPADQPGGKVVYTSFHNIAQPTDDVSQILKYLVLHL